MRKYLSSIIVGLIALVIVGGLFIYLDKSPEKNVGESKGDKGLLAMSLSEDGSYYTVTGIGSYEGGDVVIPAEYKGVPIKEIGRWAFRDKKGITSVTIPDSVTAIGESAFKGTAIVGISLPDGLTRLDGYAFADCAKLASIVLPDSLEAVGANLFNGCEGLTAVILPKKLTEIPERMCEQCTALKEITLPDSARSIGESAFFHCSALERVTLPRSLEVIGANAFYGAGISEIELPEGLKEIGNYAFTGSKLKSLTLPESLEKLTQCAFSETDIESLVIPAGVTSLADNPFAGCSKLTSIEVSTDNQAYYSKNNCIISIADGELVTFCDPDNLPDDGSIKIIGTFAYRGVERQKIVIPEGVTTLRSAAIANIRGVEEIILPASLVRIENAAISAVNSDNQPVKSLTFAGGSEQWHAIYKDENWLSSSDKVLIIDAIGK